VRPVGHVSFWQSWFRRSQEWFLGPMVAGDIRSAFMTELAQRACGLDLE